jgi:membrane-associated phospholipid phosphatase
MRNAVILLALCATLTGCSLFKKCPSCDSSAAGQTIAHVVQPPSAAGSSADDGWWLASAITPKSAVASGVFVADEPAAPKAGGGAGASPGGKPAIPADLNKDKSFWSPDREFDYLFAHYQYPKRAWWRNFVIDMPVGWWKDTKTLAQPRYLITLGIGAALAGGMQPLDHRVARHLREAPLLGGARKAGNAIGNPGTHFAAAGALYLYALAANDEVYRKRSTILLEGLVYDNVATLFLKAIFERRTPNGAGFFGIRDSFPSGHVSSTFAMAAMLDEMYGHQVGYPLYVVGGFVGLSRMQDRDHYLSDCVFGAFLGYAVGKAVFERNQVEMFGFKLEPMIEPETGAMGLSLNYNF